MPSVSAHRFGLTFGALLGSFHLVWSILVALGIAQWYMDTILRLHMIRMDLTILPFSITSAALLILVTAVIGYVIGFVAGSIWNAMSKS